MARSTTALPVHPFPARMAPELALRRLGHVSRGAKVVLDPMMGSGTIPILAAHRGYQAIGFDIDPLALLIAQTWGRSLDRVTYLAAAEQVVAEARKIADDLRFGLADPETADFVDYWFDKRAQRRLAALREAINSTDDALRTPLWCAFSRLIITKDASVSLGRDISHSRPHRVRNRTPLDPIERFTAAARDVARRHEALSETRPDPTFLRLEQADARALPIEDRSVDMTMTSPPYLTAIDYLRGHRLTLVWMGYTLAGLRELRGEAIGTERGQWTESELDEALRGVLVGRASPRAHAILRRYAADVDAVLAEQARVLRKSGQLTVVVADATVAGTSARVARLIVQLARRNGFWLTSRRRRTLPDARRYLPPPMASSNKPLDRRVRLETALTFRRSR
jgi:DNA modification methylase